ncbi:glycoside hydrolase family 19 protein [Burkholderia multivorans]|uniref:glycoside hydrolase family 19 protein n=1 Tax=Burkholderia multivorans TaxID=87883 RepID=UPI001C248CA2|nr:glycoside hydrolase family 19 protein [Burkholderia multivorans]MBU9607864.1 lytic transglycosylase domain-containing protein [Burkholderia multivorans]MBU9626360.1 lytic transglycosylase domain-containing protein [Burkholderia multivorans]
MSKTDPKKKHHPPAAPKPAQKPAEPADTPLNWAYPFTPVGKADATDPMTYFKALAKSENGFYPLGASGMWHGGVHFSHGSAEMLNQDSGVRAIADGKIVAYRLNTKYEETTYPDKTLAHYSTGFVLVRHELKLPPKPAPNQPSQPASVPAPASGTATPATPAPPDSTPANSKPASDKPLVFFSLYMHTMDWETYRKAIEQAKSNPYPDPALPVPMSYWEGERYYRVGDKAKDKQSLPKPKAPAQPAGTSNDPFGNPALPDYHLDDLPSVDPEPGLPPPPPETGLNIRDLPKGKVIGVLPKGAEVIAGEGDPAHPNWIKIKAVKSGTILPAVVGQPVSPQAPWGYLFKAELDAVVDPKPLDSVVILKEPHPVKAGEVIAHVGQYQWATKASPLPPQANYPMLHLEVFAGPDLKDFIDRSRNRAKELNDKDKPLLEIMPGAKLVSEIPAPDKTLTQAGLKLVPIGDAKGSRWVKVQPKSVTTQPAKGNKKATQTLTDVGKPLWVESRLANTVSTGNVSGWQNFPLDGAKATGPGADFRDVYRRADLDKLGAENIAIDDKGRHWWNITIGSKDGSARQGWVCETGNPLVQFRSPWEWPGFVLVDNGSVSPADMYKRFLHTAEQYLADENGTEFMRAAAKVNAGELITTLEKALDTNNDGKVTAQELKHALETRWMAEAISHLVVRNETEWGGGLGKWEELTPIMKKLTELWKTELDRLAKLQWWEQIKGVDGFPTDLSPWHVHPIGLIGNFAGAGCCAITVELLEKVYKKSGDWFTGKGGSRAFVQEFPEKFPNIYKYDKYKFVSLLNDKLHEYGIVGCYHKAHFLAQCFHESARFETTIEFASGDGYNPGVHPDAIKNGNTVAGDGPKYKGKGLIQLTWKNNYAAYSDHRKIDFVNNPELIAADMENAIDASCWYWRHKGTLSQKYEAKGDINILIDHEKNNVGLITLAVNGGHNGLAERQELFDRIKKEWGLE